MSIQGTRCKMIERTIQAIKFMEKYRTWTIQDLSNAIGVNKKNGRYWLDALSMYYPIVEVKPFRQSNSGGFMAALYKLEKD